MKYIKYFKATVLCKARYADTYKPNVSYQLVWYGESAQYNKTVNKRCSMQLCFTGQLLFICHIVVIYLQQYTEFQEKNIMLELIVSMLESLVT